MSSKNNGFHSDLDIMHNSSNFRPKGHKKNKTKGPYLMGETIGEGAFAKVKIAIHTQTNEKVAIKILDKEKTFKEEEDITRVQKEIDILKKLKHKNIIQLYEVMESKKKLYIVMEYCNGKELFEYIVKKKKLSEIEACKFFQEIIDALEYIHENKITHRDLKPENLLLDYKRSIKISDFGLSTIKNLDNSLLGTPCGTPNYAPPEMLRGDEYNGLLSDVWSCGIILYAMLCGYLPFSESKEQIIYQKIIDHDYEYPSFLSKPAVDLLKNILKVDPTERFDFKKIKKHSWFNLSIPNLRPGINIEKINIPIDEKILKKVENLGYDRELCKSNLLNNKFDSLTTVYYLILRKHIREGGKSISDLHSSEFLNYVKIENLKLKKSMNKNYSGAALPQLDKNVDNSRGLKNNEEQINKHLSRETKDTDNSPIKNKYPSGDIVNNIYYSPTDELKCKDITEYNSNNTVKKSENKEYENESKDNTDERKSGEELNKTEEKNKSNEKIIQLYYKKETSEEGSKLSKLDSINNSSRNEIHYNNEFTIGKSEENYENIIEIIANINQQKNKSKPLISESCSNTIQQTINNTDLNSRDKSKLKSTPSKENIQLNEESHYSNIISPKNSISNFQSENIQRKFRSFYIQDLIFNRHHVYSNLFNLSGEKIFNEQNFLNDDNFNIHKNQIVKERMSRRSNKEKIPNINLADFERQYLKMQEKNIIEENIHEKPEEKKITRDEILLTEDNVKIKDDILITEINTNNLDKSELKIFTNVNNSNKENEKDNRKEKDKEKEENKVNNKIISSRKVIEENNRANKKSKHKSIFLSKDYATERSIISKTKKKDSIVDNKNSEKNIIKKKKSTNSNIPHIHKKNTSALIYNNKNKHETIEVNQMKNVTPKNPSFISQTEINLEGLTKSNMPYLLQRNSLCFPEAEFSNKINSLIHTKEAENNKIREKLKEYSSSFVETASIAKTIYLKDAIDSGSFIHNTNIINKKQKIKPKNNSMMVSIFSKEKSNFIKEQMHEKELKQIKISQKIKPTNTFKLPITTHSMENSKKNIFSPNNKKKNSKEFENFRGTTGTNIEKVKIDLRISSNKNYKSPRGNYDSHILNSAERLLKIKKLSPENISNKSESSKVNKSPDKKSSNKNSSVFNPTNCNTHFNIENFDYKSNQKPYHFGSKEELMNKLYKEKQDDLDEYIENRPTESNVDLEEYKELSKLNPNIKVLEFIANKLVEKSKNLDNLSEKFEDFNVTLKDHNRTPAKKFKYEKSNTINYNSFSEKNSRKGSFQDSIYHTIKNDDDNVINVLNKRYKNIIDNKNSVPVSIDKKINKNNDKINKLYKNENREKILNEENIIFNNKIINNIGKFEGLKNTTSSFASPISYEESLKCKSKIDSITKNQVDEKLSISKEKDCEREKFKKINQYSKSFVINEDHNRISNKLIERNDNDMKNSNIKANINGILLRENFLKKIRSKNKMNIGKTSPMKSNKDMFNKNVLISKNKKFNNDDIFNSNKKSDNTKTKKIVNINFKKSFIDETENHINFPNLNSRDNELKAFNNQIKLIKETINKINITNNPKNNRNILLNISATYDPELDSRNETSVERSKSKSIANRIFNLNSNNIINKDISTSPKKIGRTTNIKESFVNKFENEKISMGSNINGENYKKNEEVDLNNYRIVDNSSDVISNYDENTPVKNDEEFLENTALNFFNPKKNFVNKNSFMSSIKEKGTKKFASIGIISEDEEYNPMNYENNSMARSNENLQISTINNNQQNKENSQNKPTNSNSRNLDDNVNNMPIGNIINNSLNKKEQVLIKPPIKNLPLNLNNFSQLNSLSSQNHQKNKNCSNFFIDKRVVTINLSEPVNRDAEKSSVSTTPNNCNLNYMTNSAKPIKSLKISNLTSRNISNNTIKNSSNLQVNKFIHLNKNEKKIMNNTKYNTNLHQKTNIGKSEETREISVQFNEDSRENKNGPDVVQRLKIDIKKRPDSDISGKFSQGSEHIQNIEIDSRIHSININNIHIKNINFNTNTNIHDLMNLNNFPNQNTRIKYDNGLGNIENEKMVYVLTENDKNNIDTNKPVIQVKRASDKNVIYIKQDDLNYKHEKNFKNYKRNFNNSDNKENKFKTIFCENINKDRENLSKKEEIGNCINLENQNVNNFNKNNSRRHVKTHSAYEINSTGFNLNGILSEYFNGKNNENNKIKLFDDVLKDKENDNPKNQEKTSSKFCHFNAYKKKESSDKIDKDKENAKNNIRLSNTISTKNDSAMLNYITQPLSVKNNPNSMKNDKICNKNINLNLNSELNTNKDNKEYNELDQKIFPKSTKNKKELNRNLLVNKINQEKSTYKVLLKEFREGLMKKHSNSLSNLQDFLTAQKTKSEKNKKIFYVNNVNNFKNKTYDHKTNKLISESGEKRIIIENIDLEIENINYNDEDKKFDRKKINAKSLSMGDLDNLFKISNNQTRKFDSISISRSRDKKKKKQSETLSKGRISDGDKSKNNKNLNLNISFDSVKSIEELNLIKPNLVTKNTIKSTVRDFKNKQTEMKKDLYDIVKKGYKNFYSGTNNFNRYQYYKKKKELELERDRQIKTTRNNFEKKISFNDQDYEDLFFLGNYNNRQGNKVNKNVPDTQNLGNAKTNDFIETKKFNNSSSNLINKISPNKGFNQINNGIFRTKNSMNLPYNTNISNNWESCNLNKDLFSPNKNCSILKNNLNKNEKPKFFECEDKEKEKLKIYSEGPIDLNFVSFTLPNILVEHYLKILNLKKISFIHTNPYKFRCTKNGLSFNLEVFRLKDDNDLFYTKFKLLQGEKDYYKKIVNYFLSKDVPFNSNISPEFGI